MNNEARLVARTVFTGADTCREARPASEARQRRWGREGQGADEEGAGRVGAAAARASGPFRLGQLHRAAAAAARVARTEWRVALLCVREAGQDARRAAGALPSSRGKNKRE